MTCPEITTGWNGIPIAFLPASSPPSHMHVSKVICGGCGKEIERPLWCIHGRAIYHATCCPLVPPRARTRNVRKALGGPQTEGRR